MNIIMFFSCWLIVFIYAVNAENFLGDDCMLHSGASGQCVLFSKCQIAIQNLSKGIRPQHCGFQGNEPIVCCPQQNQEYKADSKSKQKCADYIQIAKQPPPPGIVNGVTAEPGEFTHMVALGYGEENDIQWLCGGSLISEKFVITAAHCEVSPSTGPVKWARLGTINLKEPRRGGEPQDFKIINSYGNPDYKPPLTYNDVALLELNGTVFVSDYVFPACLNTEFDIPKTLEATGWGRTEFLGSTSNDLMKVNLEQYSNEVCTKRFASVSKRILARGIDNETQICAGGALDESKDTCQGDSGGPLHIVIDNTGFRKVYSIVGITSFGKGCGIANIPGVYTRVSHYIPWIESVVWPEH